MRPPRRAIDELWLRFRHDRDEATRHGLILHYAPLVKYVAGRRARACDAPVDGEDLISYGTFGLIDAVDRFEPERGLKFETFAVARVRGAILDELRRLDWVPLPGTVPMPAGSRGCRRAGAPAAAHLHRGGARRPP